MYVLLIILIILFVCLLYRLNMHYRHYTYENTAHITTGDWMMPPDQKYVQISNIQLQAEPVKYDNRRIIIDGQYVSGPGVSALNENIWVIFTPNIQIINGFTNFEQGVLMAPVRIYGTIMYKVPFGHSTSLYNFTLIADRIEYFDTQMPDTRDYSGPQKNDPSIKYWGNTPVEKDNCVEHYDIHVPHTPTDPTFGANPDFNPLY